MKNRIQVYSKEGIGADERMTNEQYYELKRLIKNFDKRKRIYKFNVVGLFAVALNLKIQKENTFYCAEFVKYALEQANIVDELPEIIRPDDFNNIEKSKFVYEGLLRKYAMSR